MSSSIENEFQPPEWATKDEVIKAAGGWVGISYSYEFDGFEVAGSQVPRRV